MSKPLNQKDARSVIASLRAGIPPENGVEHYAVGNEKLIRGMSEEGFFDGDGGGLIRFVSGAWGRGKTHLFRQLRGAAFAHKFLVADVCLNANSATMNKFQTVYAEIVRNIKCPEDTGSETPLQTVLRVALRRLGDAGESAEITGAVFNAANEKLMRDQSLDLDFRKMAAAYWRSFLPEFNQGAAQAEAQAEILQWFTGEGNLPNFKKNYGVSKIANKDNARMMFTAFAGFARLAGYGGLSVLFDEAEQSYSVIRKTALKDMQNNLLSLINSVENTAGLLLIYATTPDFYADPKHGIVAYGALSGRIGQPQNKIPTATQIVWNLDAIENTLAEYQQCARKIREIYRIAYPDGAAQLPDDQTLNNFIADMRGQHSDLASINFWRVLVKSTVACFDAIRESEGEITAEKIDVKKHYDQIISGLQEG